MTTTMTATTLRVTFPHTWPGWSVPEYTLTLAPSLSPTSPQYPPLSTRHVAPPRKPKSLTARVDRDADAHTDYNCDTPVFRAALADNSPLPPTSATGKNPTGKNPTGKDATTTTAVVLKFALREDLVPGLVAEARAYAGALAPLQGRAVPRCYGLYVGPGECGEVACLVLERWGECLRCRFDELGVDVRLRILQRLGEIHRHGLLHGDFAERNVLERDGDIRIIDFDRAEHHDCGCAVEFWPGGGVGVGAFGKGGEGGNGGKDGKGGMGGRGVPDVDEFGCEQLWEVCCFEMRIWGD